MAREFKHESDFAAVETPQVNKLQSLTALARFEFEAGKSHEGTKILMVEWEDDDLSRSPTGLWHVSWDGKRTVLPADDRANDCTRRYYFLLAPGASVPPTITLTYEPPPSSASTAKRPDSIQVNPLPAIFPPELGATARTAGKKGVLHTIWAKKRLRALEKEIKEESRYNTEGIALHMAIQEMEWIEANFGVGRKLLPPLQTNHNNTNNTNSTDTSTLNAGPPLSPNTPVSPAGGKRLSERLRGLKVGTSEKDLSRRPPSNQTTDAELHPLSPDEPDVAISSFSSFHIDAATASTSLQDLQARLQSQPQVHLPLHQPELLANKQPIAHSPLGFVPQLQPPQKQQPQQQPRQQEQKQPQEDYDFSSSDSRAISNTASSSNSSPVDAGEGLFAKALRPRSPDIPKGPFSLPADEISAPVYTTSQLDT